VDQRVGERVAFVWSRTRLRATEMNHGSPGSLIAYTWNESETDSLVRFELEPDGDGTRLMLRHTFEGEVDLSSYGGGWHHHLEQLVAQMDRDADRVRFDSLPRTQERVRAARPAAARGRARKGTLGGRRAEPLVGLRPELSDDTVTQVRAEDALWLSVRESHLTPP
jgi:hypothetical protein